MYDKIWTYELKTGYPSYIELLDDLVTFAQSKGWTVQTWKNAQWGYNSSSGQYEFLSGTHYYIRFEKTGYNNQILIYWLKTWDENSSDNHVRFEIVLKNPTITPDYSNSVSEDAHLQNAINRHYYGNLCIYYNIATAYFFSGNDDKYLSFVVKLDENHFYSYNFGSIISFKGERTGEDTEGQWVGNARSISYGILGQYPNFDNPNEVLWYFGKKCGTSSYDEYGYSLTASCYLNARIISLGNDETYYNISCPNGVPPYEPYPIKPLVQPMVWVEKKDINRWCPVGYLPHLIVAAQDFKNQDIITYESKKYLFFKDIKKTTMGYCYRIA